MAIKISIALRKGGSGKTTLAINLASILAINNRVLLIDTDSQCNLSLGLGVNHIDTRITLKDLFVSKQLSVKQAIHKTQYNMNIIPGHNDLVSIERGMTLYEIYLLKAFINEVEEEYDYVIIDTPPTDHYMLSSAIVASDYILIPMQIQYYAFESIDHTLSIINTAITNLNTKVKILGIIPSMGVKNTNISKSIMIMAKEKYKNLLFNEIIYSNVLIQEASLMGMPLIHYKPNHIIISTFKNIVNELLERINNEQSR